MEIPTLLSVTMEGPRREPEERRAGGGGAVRRTRGLDSATPTPHESLSLSATAGN